MRSWTNWAQRWTRFEADENIGAIVITGSDKVFAAGADIAAMKDWGYMEVYKSDYITRNWERVKTCRKPVIAAVAGYALGGGCELAMMCDIILAADTAQFGQPEVRLGVLPGAGGTQRLPRAVGKAKAMDLCLTARMMDAAGSRTRRPRLPRGAGRQAARRSDGDGREDRGLFPAGRHDDQGIRQSRLRSIAWPRGCCSNVAPSMRLSPLDDQKEGMAAFVEKRPPNFENR